MNAPVVAPYGDAAWLVEFEESTDQATVHAAARTIEAVATTGADPSAGGPPGVLRDVIVGDRTLVVRLAAESALAGTTAGTTGWREWLDEQVRLFGDGDPAVAPPRRPAVVLPVVFDGEDLGAVAAMAGIATDQVVALLLHSELRVAFVGFAPGFPYLSGLPRPLAGIVRKATPRLSVPAGAVAIGGGFASVYPASTPGGWHLVGRTPVRMFDPAVAPHSLLAPGDLVRFRPAGDADLLSPAASASGAAPRQPMRSRSKRAVEVVAPGSLTLIQDAGRSGTAGIGVPEAGAADPDSMVLANRLVGNGDGAAVLEIVGKGPVLRFGCPAHLAVVTPRGSGLGLRVDGFTVPTDAVVPLRSGQVVEVGLLRSGARAYLAVGGGFTTPVVLGSRSSDVLSGLGPGPLLPGDQLEVGPPTRPRGMLTAPSPGGPTPADRSGVAAPPGAAVLRAVPGPHAFDAAQQERFFATVWEVTPASNRVGLRLRPWRHGSSVRGARYPAPGRVRSTGTVLGAVQLPPDGSPIVLSVDRATIGGYPIIACVITADLGRLGQLRTGDPVRFEPVTPDQARVSGLAHRRAVDGRITGWYPDGPAR